MVEAAGELNTGLSRHTNSPSFNYWKIYQEILTSSLPVELKKLSSLGTF